MRTSSEIKKVSKKEYFLFTKYTYCIIIKVRKTYYKRQGVILLKKWLKIKREELGYTQESFAKKVGIAKTTYSSYEQGHRNPTVQTAKKMAKILNVSWTLFFEE